MGSSRCSYFPLQPAIASRVESPLPETVFRMADAQAQRGGHRRRRRQEAASPAVAADAKAIARSLRRRRRDVGHFRRAPRTPIAAGGDQREWRAGVRPAQRETKPVERGFTAEESAEWNRWMQELRDEEFEHRIKPEIEAVFDAAVEAFTELRAKVRELELALAEMRGELRAMRRQHIDRLDRCRRHEAARQRQSNMSSRQRRDP